MEYFVIFLAGVAAAASALLIGYLGYVSLLRAQQRRVRELGCSIGGTVERTC